MSLLRGLFQRPDVGHSDALERIAVSRGIRTAADFERIEIQRQKMEQDHRVRLLQMEIDLMQRRKT